MKSNPVLLCLALTVSAGLAQTPPAATTPIQHVVVIFQENISFDHYFATYPAAANNTLGEPIFKAAPNTPSVNGLSGPLLTANPNSAQPFRLARSQAVTCDQDHNYGDEQKAYNGGLMNRFVEAVGAASASCDIAGLGKKIVMGYYDGNTVTAFWNYAQSFAMSDNSFGTTFGPSTPGALNLISGQTHGATSVSGSAANIVNGTMIGDLRPAGDDCNAANAATATMSGKNAGDLLNAKGLTWGWFQGGFKPTSRNADGKAVCGSTHKNIAGTSSSDYVPHHEPFQFFAQTANLHHMPPTSVAKVGQTDQANHQYDLTDFFAALSAGNLPNVSYLKAAAYQDGHAANSDPIDEQNFVVSTINAIMQSPFWSSTAVFIAYDDSDGWYDHVMGPIVNQSMIANDNLTGAGACGNGSTAPFQGRCGYGPRLPLLAISPYARVNYVDHVVSDQSSILRFIEDNWSLGRIGGNSTDAIAGSLLGMFSFDAPGAKTVLLDPNTGLVASVAAPVSVGVAAVTKAVANPKSATTTLPQFQLDATASTSFDGAALTYQWTLAAGSLNATILNANSATPLVQFQGTPGVYTFTLTVTDSAGGTSSDTVAITLL